jgi:hypothetical protein
MVTVVPPALGPDDGATFVTLGADTKEVNSSAATAVLVPAGDVT